jgi:hypothetical protein
VTAISHIPPASWGYAVEQLVEALRYKPERLEFDSRWCHSSGPTMAFGSIQLKRTEYQGCQLGVKEAGA